MLSANRSRLAESYFLPGVTLHVAQRFPLPKETLDMPQPDIAQLAQQWANDIFVWIGFGTVAGMLAKAIMPGRDPGGPIATLGIGIGGAVIGSGIISFFAPQYHVTPLTPIGFLVATGGAFVLLFFYRLLAGYIIQEDGEGFIPAPHWRHRSYRRRREPAYDERPYRD